MKRREALVLGLGRFGGGVAAVRHLLREGYAVRVTAILNQDSPSRLRRVVWTTSQPPSHFAMSSGSTSGG